MRKSRGTRIVVENAIRPGTRTVDGAYYRPMRQALLRVLPRVAPGLTLDEARAAVLPHLPEAIFPDGAKAGWWFKTVQLDLEAKRLIVRARSRPVRIHRR